MPPNLETSFRVKRADDAGSFEGIASVFNTRDRVGDIVLPGAFRETLTRLAKSGTRLPLLSNHDSSKPIGYVVSAEETDEGLVIAGKLLLNTEGGRLAYQMMQGDAGYLSIGYRVEAGDSYNDKGITYLRRVDLMEISHVSTPAHPDARVTKVKRYESPADLERALRADLGLPSRAARKLVAGGWPALTGDDYEDDDALAALAKRLQTFTKNLRVKP